MVARQEDVSDANRRKKRRSRREERLSVTVGRHTRRTLHEMAVAAGIRDAEVAAELVQEAIAYRRRGVPVPVGDEGAWSPRDGSTPTSSTATTEGDPPPPGPFGWVLPNIDCCCCHNR